MSTSAVSQDIAVHREAIDAIDTKILKLLNDRAVHSLAIRREKERLHLARFDASREEEIKQRLCEENSGPLYNENIRDVYSVLLRVMREVPDDESEAHD